MADIELVIKIPEEIRLALINNIQLPINQQLKQAIINGVTLPKGHGRLIDADVLVDGMEDDYEFCKVVNATPTIIEAESED